MPRSNTAEFAKLEMEVDDTLYAMAALTDSGDHQVFSSAASLLSDRVLKDGSTYSPKVFPNGLDTGGKVTPGAANDTVDVAALTCYLAGVKVSVGAAAAEAVTRGVTNGYRINSVTVDNAGAVTVIAGTESTSFSETRGAAGGPPYIPTDSIEVAQVRLTSTVAAKVTADEILAVVGQHLERYDFPLWDEVWEDGDVKFITALPLIHTGDVPKAVYGKVYEPIFAEVSLASDFVAPENSYSVNSTQVYNATVGVASKSLGQGSFNAKLKDGVTDAVVKQAGETLWFRYYPDRYKAPYILCQGALGMARTFPAGDNISGAFTISAKETATNKQS